MSEEAVLELDNVNAYYGLSHVVQEVSLRVGRECVALMGRNGSGKTSLVRTIMGMDSPKASGRIHFKGEPIDALRPHQVARRGIGYVPQGRRLFPSLTVHEHLRLTERASEDGAGWDEARIYDLFPGLAGRRHAYGDEISGGERSMLAIARALMTNPQCLILDEPSEGLAPALVDTVCDSIRRLAEEGVTVLLVEQNLKAAERAASRVYVMAAGRIVHEQDVASFAADHDTRNRYLGLAG